MNSEDSNYLAELDDLEIKEYESSPGIERYIAKIELLIKLEE